MPKRVIPEETPREKLQRETIETIAATLASLSKAVANLLDGPLNKKALILLLSASSRCTQYQVEAVLKAVETLEADWLNKK